MGVGAYYLRIIPGYWWWKLFRLKMGRAEFGGDERSAVKRPQARPKVVRGWVREGVSPSHKGVRVYYSWEHFDTFLRSYVHFRVQNWHCLWLR